MAHHPYLLCCFSGYVTCLSLYHHAGWAHFLENRAGDAHFFFRKTGPETIKIDQIKKARGGLVVGLSSCERGVDQCAHCCRVGLSSNSGSMTHILWYILDCLGEKMLGIPRNTINMAPPMSPRHMEVLWSLLFIFVVTFSLCPFSSCVPHSWGKNILGTNSCWKIADGARRITYRLPIEFDSFLSSSLSARSSFQIFST